MRTWWLVVLLLLAGLAAFLPGGLPMVRVQVPAAVSRAAADRLVAFGVTDLLLLSGLLLGAYLALQAGWQTRLLAELNQVQAQTCLLLRRAQRRDAGLADLPGGVCGWIAGKLKEGFGIYPQLEPNMITALGHLPLVLVTVPDGLTAVISPLGRKALRRRLGREASRLTALGGERRARLAVQRGRVVRHALGWSGDTFDIEARLVGEALGINWGQPDGLYFYWLAGRGET